MTPNALVAGSRAACRRRLAPAALPALLLALGVACAGGGRAQSNDEIQSATQLNLSTPGARSLGLGGAFVAVADDATAAYANPAGLGQLIAPEVSLEGRAWNLRSTFVERGHRPETGLTGIGIDVVDGLQSGEIERQETAISFASYAHPGRRWTLALHHHQLAEFRAALRTQGAFVGFRDDSTRLSPAVSALDLEIAGQAVSAAYRVADGVLLGASLARYRLALDSRTQRYRRAAATGDALADSRTGGFYGPADFRDDNVLSVQTQHGDDADLAWSVGSLWQPSARWSVGAVYRSGADFDVAASVVDGPAGEAPGELDPTLGGGGVFHVPDAWAVGVAWRPAEAWLLALDWTRVEYGDMLDDLVNVLAAARGQLDGFTVDDGDEIHFGVEYQTLSTPAPLSLRLGAWLDPDHRLRFEGRDPPLRTRFRPGEDEVHVAGGVGVVLGRVQLDAAYDHAASVDTLSLSAVHRF